MKRKLFTGIAAVLLISGLMMLIAPRISNRIGEQIAHSTIDDFKALKSKATSDEPTEKKESSEDSSANTKPKKNNAQNEYASIAQNNDGTIFEGELSMSENTTVDFDRLYSDSIAYNENLKKHQHELLTNEQSYQFPALNLSSYGITSGVYGLLPTSSLTAFTICLRSTPRCFNTTSLFWVSNLSFDKRPRLPFDVLSLVHQRQGGTNYVRSNFRRYDRRAL